MQNTVQPHIAVIDPALRVAELDCFNAMARRSTLPLSYHLPALQNCRSLEVAEPGISGIVILGSGASVHDGHPWQAELIDWLRPQLNKTPVLGLCYGHQLLAHIYGGSVELLWDGDKARGLRRVFLEPHPLWGNSLDGEFVVSHREGVTRCPAEFEVVGASPEVAIDAIAHQHKPIWGFQPHIEATAAFMTNNGIDGPRTPEVFGPGNRLVGRFLDYCADPSSGGTGDDRV
jgi:GMP synthase (glutamine-hydrolysing)